jgi:hypothetical protein
LTLNISSFDDGVFVLFELAALVDSDNGCVPPPPSPSFTASELLVIFLLLKEEEEEDEEEVACLAPTAGRTLSNTSESSLRQASSISALTANALTEDRDGGIATPRCCCC